MKIRDNASGRTAVRHLGTSQGRMAKTLEKLSSGYRINRSADDASGLAISEKMRMQMTGLGQAHQNSQDGVSLIQVGEGALEEMHAMLNRAVELAEQSANGTYQDEIDRESLQRELDQLCDEIDRIAEDTSFNSIRLFQNQGFAYESTVLHKTFRPAASPNTQTSRVSQTQSQAEPRTLEELLERKKPGELNILYVERNDSVTTDTTVGTGSQNTLGRDITVNGKPLSQILKTEIIPNTVQNILKNYPAFSYLTGSSIGIGLEYFSGNATGKPTTLAYVEGQVRSTGTHDGTTVTSRTDFMTYTLGVNIDNLANKLQMAGGREELEATIAHEMIHAFMDEATTSGMFGKVEGTGTNLTADAGKFPDWFIEGMAQTASGPGNWLLSGGLNLSETSTDDVITAAIQKDRLGSGTTASQYGTGYLACMYLGAVIQGGGTPSAAVDATTISGGLTKLMNEVISGKSLDSAIQSLTNGKFASTSEFQTKFNGGSPEISAFVRNLLAATGSGLGGIVSGDLSASDLTPNTDLGDTVKLFLLDPSNSKIQNAYPEGYKVYSGGTTSTDGTAPTDFTPTLSAQEYGNLIVTGAGASDLEYDAASGTLKIKSGSNITISMKSPEDTSIQNKILLDGAKKVTLDGVNLSDAAALTIKQDVEITFEGETTLGGISLDHTNGSRNIVFQGTGQLKTSSFASDRNDTIRFQGGAVIVGNGSGNIDAKAVIDHASVAAQFSLVPSDSAGKPLASADLPWAMLSSLKGDLTSVTFDSTRAPVLLHANDSGKLWLDPDTIHRITFTDASGVSKTLAANYDTASGAFQWQDAVRPFTITGTEGQDWHYEEDGTTLVITSTNALTISGGTTTDENGNPLIGRIKIADNIGSVNLTLGECKASSANGSAFDLGAGNSVTLNLTAGATSAFTSGKNYAGIAIGTGSQLTIKGPDSGTLLAEGGSGSAGIGRSNSTVKLTDQTSSITIEGGTIKASGGNSGAGIGAGNQSDFGDITITGGIITASGESGGAGIGGAYRAATGNITITGGTIVAESDQHGAGIGGGWSSGATNGTIDISGGEITARSGYHGTGIGAGCSGTSEQITIHGNAIIHQASGGDNGAGIGASWNGSCKGVTISGDAVIELAQGGTGGAGIGAGNQNSRLTGNIVIDTTKEVTAEGGVNGVGIGSGYSSSSCGDITIKQGTVTAIGSTDSTGIGAGRGSTSGNITIGDAASPNNKVVVSAIGGMTNNGGNIISYTDSAHTNPGTVTITGNNTTVRPGGAGEGLYSTSGAVDENGDPIYAYPVYLFETDPPLDAGEGLTGLPLPAGASNIQIKTTGADGTGKTWEQDLSHRPLSENYVFVWMKGQDQTLTIDYTDPNDNSTKTVTLDLIFHADAGVFRIASQPVPPAAEKPGYNTDPDPVDPKPNPPEEPTQPDPEPEIPLGEGGIILQIGANYGETLEVPRFFLSVAALNMENLDISTQEHAWESMPVIQNAIQRVSDIRGTYGALANRLEHNQQSLSHTLENTTAAESRIRDADMAREYMDYVRLSINSQAAQAMAAQSNQSASYVLQLLQ